MPPAQLFASQGNELTPALLQAIEGSRISVIVFSENYAFSEWCLDDLAHILHCRKEKQQTVYPVFYKVKPSDVRDHDGGFGKALADLELKFKHDSEKVLKWRGALTEASNLAGWTYTDGYESTFMDTIVENIAKQVCFHADVIVADYPVGIECRLKEMHDLLDVKSSDVRMIGIWGIAGIGKTTIAVAVYNSLACKFDGCCFLDNVAKVSMELDGPVKLRKMLLSKILRSDLRTEACEGVNAIKDKLNKRKVLLVLDDVDQTEQLTNLVEADWFGLGSRIVITTRDKRSLNAKGFRDNLVLYKLKELDDIEALKLFSKNAFPQESLPHGYAELSKDVLKFAQGLPLALQYLGKLLYDRTVEVWKEELQSHMKSIDDSLYQTLIRSYDALEDPVKEVFLDIACFFKGKLKNDVVQSLGPDHKPNNSIKVLQEKVLINIQDNHIYMHSLLEVPGKKIVDKQSPNEPSERSRLWFPDDVYKILSEGKGTYKIKGVIVLPSPHEIPLSDTCFSGMTNLKYFISSEAEFSGGMLQYLPDELRLIDWRKYPFENLPFNDVLRKLVKLNMPHSSILNLDKFKRSESLKYINLEGCESLKEIPNFSEFPNLRDLNLNYCTSLAKVDKSVGKLHNLVALSLSGCRELVTFPTTIALTSVRRIILRDCIKVTSLPVINQRMECLTWLDQSGTGIKELPDASLRHLIKLEELSLRDCEKLTNLPCSIYELQHVWYLDLHNCSELEGLPHWNAAVPPANLNDLNLGGCKRLVEIPELPPTVKSVIAADCVQLHIFTKLSNIMQHKESRIIERIILSNCGRLCDSLIRDMKQTKNILRSQASLCSLFLSCKQSEFEVVFPGSEVPKWFSHSKKLKELTEESRFSFEIPPNFRLGNRGLAICAAAEVVEGMNSEKQNSCCVTATIDINGGSKILRVFNFEQKIMGSGHVWLCYIPFIVFTCLLLPPFTCGVTLEHKSQGSVHCISYGVHPVIS